MGEAAEASRRAFEPAPAPTLLPAPRLGSSTPTDGRDSPSAPAASPLPPHPQPARSACNAVTKRPLETCDQTSPKRIKLESDEPGIQTSGPTSSLDDEMDMLVRSALGDVSNLVSQISMDAVELCDPDEHDRTQSSVQPLPSPCPPSPSPEPVPSPTPPHLDLDTPPTSHPHLFTDPIRHAQLMSFPVLRHLSLQLLLLLSCQPREPVFVAIRDLNCDVGRTYTGLRKLFESCWSIYSRSPPILYQAEVPVTASDDIATPPPPAATAVSTVRLANMASTCVVLLSPERVLLPEVHTSFLPTFLDQTEVDISRDLAEFFVSVKVLLALARLNRSDSNGKMPPEAILDEVFLGNLEESLRKRHPDSDLTDSDRDLLDLARARKDALWQEIERLDRQAQHEQVPDVQQTQVLQEAQGSQDGAREPILRREDAAPEDRRPQEVQEAQRVQEARSRASDRKARQQRQHLDSLMRCLASHLRRIREFLVAEAVERGIPLPNEEPPDGSSSGSEDADSDVDPDADQDDYSEVSALGMTQDPPADLDPEDEPVDPPSVPPSLPPSLPTGPDGEDDDESVVDEKTDLVADYKDLEALVAASTSHYVRTTLHGLSPMTYHHGSGPGTSAAHGLAPLPMMTHGSLQDDDGSLLPLDLVVGGSLPPNQSFPSAVLYDKARQAAMSKSSSHARREGIHSTRRPWSQEEERALMTGLDMVKGPHWSQILTLFGPSGTISDILRDRTQVQLKDKARNLKLFFLKTNSEMPYYLQAVTGELKTRAPTQAARKEAEERAKLHTGEEHARVSGIGSHHSHSMPSLDRRPLGILPALPPSSVAASGAAASSTSTPTSTSTSSTRTIAPLFIPKLARLPIAALQPGVNGTSALAHGQPTSTATVLHHPTPTAGTIKPDPDLDPVIMWRRPPSRSPTVSPLTPPLELHSFVDPSDQTLMHGLQRLVGGMSPWEP